MARMPSTRGWYRISAQYVQPLANGATAPSSEMCRSFEQALDLKREWQARQDLCAVRMQKVVYG